MRSRDLFGLAILFIAAMPAEGQALCIAPTTLNGVWISKGGDTYRIRDSARRALHGRPRPREVWWVGTSRDNGRSFVNVFKGLRRGSVVTGEWSDIRGTGRGTLELALDINPSGPAQGRISRIRQIGGTGSGFGAIEWRPECDDHIVIPQ